MESLPHSSTLVLLYYSTLLYSSTLFLLIEYLPTLVLQYSSTLILLQFSISFDGIPPLQYSNTLRLQYFTLLFSSTLLESLFLLIESLTLVLQYFSLLFSGTQVLLMESPPTAAGKNSSSGSSLSQRCTTVLQLSMYQFLSLDFSNFIVQLLNSLCYKSNILTYQHNSGTSQTH